MKMIGKHLRISMIFGEEESMNNVFSLHCYPLFLFLVGGFLVGLFVGNLVAGIFFGCLQYIILLQESRKRRKKYEVKGGSDVL